MVKVYKMTPDQAREFGPIAAYHSGIFLCEEICNTFHISLLKILMLHEVTHIKYCDSLMRKILIMAGVKQSIISMYELFAEKRADSLACLVSRCYESYFQLAFVRLATHSNYLAPDEIMSFATALVSIPKAGFTAKLV